MKATTMIWMRVFLLKGAYNIVLRMTLLLWADEILPWLGAPAGNPAPVTATRSEAFRDAAGIRIRDNSTEEGT
jgi:hypothetical protein